MGSLTAGTIMEILWEGLWERRGDGQNPGEALDLDPSLGPSSICSLVTRSPELSRHLFSYGPECAESLSANCSPSRGLPVLLFVRLVSEQLFLQGTSLPRVLTVPHGGTGRGWTEQGRRCRSRWARPVRAAPPRPPGCSPCGLRAGPPAGGGPPAPCLSFPPGGPLATNGRGMAAEGRPQSAWAESLDL